MDEARWRRVRELFAAALERPAGEREAFLAEASGEDEALRREVESLLVADRDAGGFLSSPPDAASGDAAAVPDPYLGRTIGSYRLLERLGRGGMGAVYLAVRADDAYEKRVAVKVLPAGTESEEIVRRFRTERQILAGLDHPGIARLLDGGATPEGLPYLVLEHVEGEPLLEHCARRRLGVEERVRLFLEIAEAVAFAHRNLVVHRDLKPDNILVTGDGTPKLLDFGIAKLLNPELSGEVAPTRMGMRPMTPEYASPEQVAGGRITTASDVYSLGVLLYELLAGRHPYREAAETHRELERAVAETEPRPPSEAARRAGDPPLARRLGGDLDAIVARALRKEPEHRYASVGAMADDLRDHLAGRPVAARRGTLAYRARKFGRRHRWGLAAGAAALVALVAFGLSLEHQRREAARERDRAERERERSERVSEFLVDLFAVADPEAAPGLFAGGEDVPGATVTARELLDRASSRLAGGLEDEPRLRATLLTTLATTYRRLGLVGRARPLAERALALRRETLGDDHPEVAESLYELAALEIDAGAYARAETLLVRALEIRRGETDPDPAAIAEILDDLGVVLLYRDRPEQARRRLDEALEIRLRSLGDEHMAVAETLNNLAALHQSQGDLATAEPLYRRSLELHRRLLGDDHPRLAVTLNNLATLLMRRGRGEEAEPLFSEALAVRRRALGDEHPDVAETLANLGRLRLASDPEGAEPLLEEALAIRRARLSPAHPMLAHSLYLLAEARLARGEPDEAEGAAAEALAILSGALPPGDRRTALARGLLGECLAELGRAGEAVPLLRSAHRTLAAIDGPDAPATRRLATRLAELGSPVEPVSTPGTGEETGDAAARTSGPPGSAAGRERGAGAAG